ncbi:hypothetical protein FHU39_003465 [Flexivirga oryzae]|uniref:Uncharacterized protein n=1 Tax=Flexivirga oryzae TaxID=1794944 RepID=A0A839NBT5_9MICO|nr:hypothetical protein [Flexivirga oryzae]
MLLLMPTFFLGSELPHQRLVRTRVLPRLALCLPGRLLLQAQILGAHSRSVHLSLSPLPLSLRRLPLQFCEEPSPLGHQTLPKRLAARLGRHRTM